MKKVKYLYIHTTYIHTVTNCSQYSSSYLGKLKRRNKEGRGLYLSGAKDGSGLINGVDMLASANSKRGAELGQVKGVLLYLEISNYIRVFSQDRRTLSACQQLVLQLVVYKSFR